MFGLKIGRFSQTPVPGTKKFDKELKKRNNDREISGKFGVVASAANEKVNRTGAEENAFRLVPVLGHGARVLPLELVPGYGAQISARVTTKGYGHKGKWS